MKFIDIFKKFDSEDLVALQDITKQTQEHMQNGRLNGMYCGGYSCSECPLDTRNMNKEELEENYNIHIAFCCWDKSDWEKFDRIDCYDSLRPLLELEDQVIRRLRISREIKFEF